MERMLAIEREAEAQAAANAEARIQSETAPRYGVLAAVFRDEEAATRLLTDLLDAGYDGSLVSGDSEGTVLLELRLGPYESLAEAERVANTVRRSFGVTPSVLVERATEQVEE